MRGDLLALILPHQSETGDSATKTVGSIPQIGKWREHHQREKKVVSSNKQRQSLYIYIGGHCSEGKLESPSRQKERRDRISRARCDRRRSRLSSFFSVSRCSRHRCCFFSLRRARAKNTIQLSAYSLTELMPSVCFSLILLFFRVYIYI